MTNDYPHGWHAGPPKSESEAWAYERRNEILQIATTLMVAEVTEDVEPHEWTEVIDRAVSIAAQLVQEVDRRAPRY